MRRGGLRTVSAMLLALTAAWTLCPPAAGEEAIPEFPQPDKGWSDCNVSISADGCTVAWFHREGWDTRVCLMTVPFDRPPSMIVLENLHPHAAPCPVLSGDGKSIFLTGRPVRHSVVADGRLLPFRELPGIEACPLDFRVNRDGSRLAMLIAGPRTAARAPAWYALSAASVGKDAKWVSYGLLTAAEFRKDAESPMMSAGGQVIVYAWDGKLFEWREGSGVSALPVEIPGARLRPVSMTPDAGRLVFSAATEVQDGRPDVSLHFIARSGPGWTPPARVLDRWRWETTLLTAAGDAVVFIESEYSPELNRSTKNTLRRVTVEGGKPGRPETILELPLHAGELALSHTGAFAFTVVNCSDPWLGQVYYGRDLKAGCDPLCLTGILQQALGKGDGRRK
jgi:hypothetical protein